MRPGRVVVTYELGEHTLKVASAEDEHPLQALPPGRPDESLRVSVSPRRPHRGLDDPGAFAGEHLIEGRQKLGVTVTDQKLETPAALPKGNGKVAGLLGGPSAVGMGGDTGQEDLATLQFDEEHDGQPSQTELLHGEEIAGQHP